MVMKVYILFFFPFSEVAVFFFLSSARAGVKKIMKVKTPLQNKLQENSLSIFSFSTSQSKSWRDIQTKMQSANDKERKVREILSPTHCTSMQDGGHGVNSLLGSVVSCFGEASVAAKCSSTKSCGGWQYV
jgi:hypothetical protein